VHRSSNASLSSSSDAINLSFSAALLDRVGDLVNGDDASPPNASSLHAAVDDAALADAAVDEAARADDACADNNDRPPPPADDDT